MVQYQPEEVVRKYSEGNERGRIETSIDTAIMYNVETSYIQRYMPKRDCPDVIDVGGGPGRYAVDMARMGARVMLVDITPKHIEQARALAQEEGVSDRFLGFQAMDALEIGMFGAGRFHLAVCFGMLNYLLEKDLDLLKTIRLILAEGSHLLLSVMGLYGAVRHAWAGMRFKDADYRMQETSTVQTGVNELKMPARKFYTAQQIRELVAQAGFTVVEVAGTPAIAGSLKIDGPLDAASMDYILSMERQCCTLPTLLDNGQHLIVVAQA